MRIWFFLALLPLSLMSQAEVWQRGDIGTVGTAGSNSYNSGTDAFTVTGAGSGINGITCLNNQMMRPGRAVNRVTVFPFFGEHGAGFGVVREVAGFRPRRWLSEWPTSVHADPMLCPAWLPHEVYPSPA